MKTKRQTIGFTLVELLVVIAIIAMLVTLLLPAVQAARESARRAQCLNNLKQISLGVQNFHGARNRIPRSHNYEALSGRGWITESLPFFEEQAKYDLMEPYFDGKFADGTGINHPDLANVVNQPIPTFRCPSAASKEFATDQFQWVGREHALTNYKGIIGNTRMGGAGVGSPDCHRSPDCRGLFWRFSFMKTIQFKNIVDGLSKTFLAGDDLPRYNRHSALYHGNGDYSSTHFPMNVKPIDPTTIAGNWPLSITFRSDHPGGCYFAFLDGSAAFISENIDFDIYRFLSTRNGEELVSGYLD